jgi:hypothetical protein
MGLNYNPTIVPDGLVMYFDPANSRSYSGSGNTIYDITGNGNNCTFASSFTYDNTNKGQVFINGSTQSGTVSNNSTLWTTNQFSYSLWSKKIGPGDEAPRGMIISKDVNYIDSSYLGKTLLSVYSSAIYSPRQYLVYGNSAASYNEWRHYTATYDGTIACLYENGALTGSTSMNIQINSTSNPLYIGQYDGGGFYYNGSIGSVMVYNRALSADEAKQNYNATKSRYITPENIVTNGLVLNIDSGNRNSYPVTGTSIYDLSGFGNTGTLTNGPTFSGLNGGAIVFDGVDDYVISSVNSGISGTASRSICAWAKFNNISSSVVCGIGDAAVSNNLFELQAYQNKMIGHPYGSAIFSQTTLSTGVWYFAAYTYDGTTCKLYLNGILEASENRVLTTINTPFSLGKKGFNPNSNMNGSISNAQLYNRALTQQEVLQNYNATKSRFGL